MLMRKILSFVLAGVVIMTAAGCSKTANKTQVVEEKKPSWERIGDGDSVAFKVYAKDPIDTAQGRTTPIFYVGCGKLTMVMVRLPGELSKSVSFNAKVGLVLDGTNAQRQDWQELTNEDGDHFAPQSAEAKLHLLTQVLEAKTLKAEFTPKGGSLQSAIFNVEGFKESFGHEPACKSWRDPSNYK